MELKTKEDLIKAFFACGKKFGFCQHDTDYKLIGFCNEIPNDDTDAKYYLYSQTKYKDGGSYTEHVTKEWNRSEETYERCEPYDVHHHYTDEYTVRPMFVWFVMPSFISDGKIYHIVTDIRGTQHNRRSDGTYDKSYCPYESFDIFGSIKKYNSDHLVTKNQHDSRWGNSFNHVKEKELVWGVYYQNGKLYVDYRSCCGTYIGEAEITGKWRAFTTYEEVLAFQKQETDRLTKQLEQDNVQGLEQSVKEKLNEIINLSKDTIKLIDELKVKTHTGKSSHTDMLKKLISEYEDFKFDAYKWIKCRNYM